MPLSELELSFIHIAILINTDALSMPLVLEPLAVILALASDLHTEAIPDSVEPLAIIDVLSLLAVSLGAKSALSMSFIV